MSIILLPDDDEAFGTNATVLHCQTLVLDVEQVIGPQKKTNTQ
jgi:hypothetical protein